MTSRAGAVIFIGECLSYLDTPASTAAIRSSALNENTNWQTIIGLANRNGVTCEFWLALNRKGLTDCLPADVRDYLVLVYDLNRRRNQVILDQALEVAKALNAWNIRPVFMKGCLTLIEGALDIGSSMMTDIDIIVKDEEISKTFSALRSLGYAILGEPTAPSHAWTFHRSMSLVTVDLHCDVGPQRNILRADVAIQGATDITDNTTPVGGLNVTHRVCLLIMNFGIFERHYCAGDIPLRNLHHLASLCHQHAGEIDWQVIANTMAAHQLEAEAGAWGFLARRILSAPVPTRLYRGRRARAHLIRSFLQLFCPQFDFAVRWYAAIVWPLNRFRMDYRYGCGIDGLSLLGARVRHIAGVIARQSSALLRRHFFATVTARPTGRPE